jgi:hypothetical protein
MIRGVVIDGLRLALFSFTRGGNLHKSRCSASSVVDLHSTGPAEDRISLAIQVDFNTKAIPPPQSAYSFYEPPQDTCVRVRVRVRVRVNEEHVG